MLGYWVMIAGLLMMIGGPFSGFSLGQAAVGGFLLWPLGLLAGMIGASQVELVCLRCGHRWAPS